MANKLFGTKLCAAALATFALASCQSETTLLEPSADNMRDVTLTVTASKGEMTRTNLELSEDQKKLLLTWNLGDEIQVAEEDGRYAGKLKVTEFVDDSHTQAKFVGDIRVLDKDGTHSLTFYYLGKEAEYKGTKGRQMPDMVYDFSSQTNTEVGALAAYDLLVDACDIEVTKGNATFKSLFMKRQFAYGRFTLLYNDQPLQFGENTVVTINTEAGDIKTGATVAFPSEITSNGNGSITLTTSVNDFYATFVPGSAEGKFKFNVTIDGQEYEGYSNSYLVEKNDFYRKAQGLTVGEALPINVKKTDGSDDEHEFTLTYNANFGDNETKPVSETGVGFTYTYTLAEYASLFTNTNEGYTFLGWTEDAAGEGELMLPDATLTVNYNEPKTVYAKWEQSKFDYTLVFEDGEGKQLDSKNIKELDNTTVTIAEYSTEAAKGLIEGRTFLGWAKKSEKAPTATSIIETVTFTKDNAVITLVPVYKKYTWLWKWVDDPADNVGNGSYGASRETGYGPNQKLLSVFPCDNPNSTMYQKNVKDGYTFSHWEYKGKKVTTNDTLYTEVVEDQDPIEVYIYAKWIKNPIDYSIIYEDNTGNELGKYEFPSKFDKIDVNVKEHAPSVTAPAGYEFKGWALKGTTTVKTSVELTEDNPTATVVPVFEKLNTITTGSYQGGKFN